MNTEKSKALRCSTLEGQEELGIRFEMLDMRYLRRNPKVNVIDRIKSRSIRV